MILDRLFVPGSILWLARHQIRLSWRLGRLGKKIPSWLKPVFTILFVAFLSFTMGYGIAKAFEAASGDYKQISSLAGAIVLTLMISGISMNMMGSFMTITEKGDLDLLLSSPIPPHRFVAARLISSAWRGFCIYAGFATIFFGASIVMISPMFASIYVVVAGFAILDAALTYMIARQALLWFGLRNGRRAIITLGAVGVLVGLFGYQMVSSSGSLGQLAAKEDDPNASLVLLHDWVVALTSNLSWLGGTILGDWLGALVFPVAGAVLSAAVLHFAGKRYDQDVAFLNGQNDHAPHKARKAHARQFRRPALVMVFHKEWLSLTRDPLFVSQLIVPLFTMVPFLGFVWNAMANPEEQSEMAPVMGAVFAAITVFNVTMLTSSLAWLTASVEEARDLLQASPLDPKIILQGKVLAASGPAIIELFLVAALVAWAWPVAALTILVMGTATCAGACVIEFSRPRPTKRPKMTQRPDRSLVAVLFGLGLGILWACAAGLAAAKIVWWLLPAALAITISYVAWATRPREFSSIPMSQPLVAVSVGSPGGPWQRVDQT
jgi:ABC-2 type transport system permease protein